MSVHVTTLSWDDAPHLSDEAKAEILSAYGSSERDARTKGVPQLGAGAIYPIPEEMVVVDPIELPAWYARVYALDVGWNRTAALWGAHDRESDIVYLYSEHYVAHAEPIVHAAAIKGRGAWIPGVIDPASRGRSQVDGEQLYKTYTDPDTCGLNLALADNAVEAGIYAVETRLSSGRLKIFRTLTNLLGEYRIYRRDDKGKVVKQNDHLMDCARYLIVSGLSRAVPVPADQWAESPGFPAVGRARHQVDYQPMAGMWDGKPDYA